MHIQLAICFAVQGFFPNRDAENYTVYNFDTLAQAKPLISFVISVMSSSFGMGKFLLDGPIRFLSKEYPLGGLLSPPFISVVLMNTMFGVRILCLENIFFTSYVYVDNRNFNPQSPDSHTVTKTISPLIAPEYRLLVYFIPCIISLVINLIQLTRTTKGKIQFLKKHPQLIVSPCFSAMMFEGITQQGKESRIKIWRFGSILNAVFIGCVPQMFLILSEFLKGTPSWTFIGGRLQTDPECSPGCPVFETNDALIKHPYGNIVFAGLSSAFYLILILTFFFKEGDSLCAPCLMGCLNYDPDSLPDDTETDKNDSSQPIDKPQDPNLMTNMPTLHATTNDDLLQSNENEDSLEAIAMQDIQQVNVTKLYP